MNQETEDDDKKAKEKSNIQIHDEFGKAKRNLLWFCSIAILLWMVPSVNSEFQAPFLGVGAKVSAFGLRFVIWIAAAYCLIGFWRQARNVDRINSEVLYEEQFENLETRLTKLGTTFGGLAAECQRLSMMTTPVSFSNPPDLPTAKTKIFEGINAALKRVDELIHFGAANPRTAKSDSHVTLLRQFDEAKKGLELAIEQPFNELESANKAIYDELEGVRRVSAQTLATSKAILDIRMGFQSLNEQIRGEHRWMYRYYDKWATYAFFVIATAASFANQIGLGFDQFSQLLERVTFASVGSVLVIFLSIFGAAVGVTAVLMFAIIMLFNVRRWLLIRRLKARDAPQEEINKFRSMNWSGFDDLDAREVQAALKAEQLRLTPEQEQMIEVAERARETLVD